MKVVKFLLFVSMLALFGCSGGNKLSYTTPTEAFNKGLDLFNRQKYVDAIELFKGVFDFGRTNEVADEAQFYLAQSYQNNKDYILAVNEYTRFINLYRTDPRAKDAEYALLICYYAQSPSYELDQTDTERALTHMNIYLQRYPNDDKAFEVGEMIQELTEKLGRKQYEAANIYMRNTYYQAAAITYERVLERYPTTTWADDALLGAMNAYLAYAKASVVSKQSERFQKVVETYNRLVDLFPSSDLLKEAELVYVEASGALASSEN